VVFLTFCSAVLYILETVITRLFVKFNMKFNEIEKHTLLRIIFNRDEPMS